MKEARITISGRCGVWFAVFQFESATYMGGQYATQALAVAGAASAAVNVGAESVTFQFNPMQKN